MSSLGYVIAFMICGAEAPDCEIMALRTSRYGSLAQCQRAIPEAIAAARRSPSARPGLTVGCQSLDALCPGQVAGSSWSMRKRQVHRVSGTSASPRAPAVEAALKLLCAPPPQEGC